MATKATNSREQIRPSSEMKISGLNLNCWEEVLEWLTMEEMCTLGQTCKIMQRIVGLYLKERMEKWDWPLRITPAGIDVNDLNMNIFAEFVDKISCYDYPIESFQFIKSKLNKALKSISFIRVTFTPDKIECIKESLSEVEILHIQQGSIQFSLYENILKFCPKLKSLTLHVFKAPSDWLLRKYPNLEELSISIKKEVKELKIFFALNPTIKRISIDDVTLILNWNTFITCGLKFDDLQLKLHQNYSKNPNYFSYFMSFREKVSYKRLSVEVSGSQHSLIGERLKPGQKDSSIFPEFTVLYICYADKCNVLTLSQYVLLNELYFTFCTGLTIYEMEIVSKSLLNLEKVEFAFVSMNQIFPFVCHSVQLKNLKAQRMSDGIYCQNNILDLVALNNKRKKLKDAKKLVMMMEEKVFIPTKWANTKTDFSMVAIERADEYND